MLKSRCRPRCPARSARRPACRDSRAARGRGAARRSDSFVVSVSSRDGYSCGKRARLRMTALRTMTSSRRASVCSSEESMLIRSGRRGNGTSQPSRWQASASGARDSGTWAASSARKRCTACTPSARAASTAKDAHSHVRCCPESPSSMNVGRGASLPAGAAAACGRREGFEQPSCGRGSSASCSAPSSPARRTPSEDRRALAAAAPSPVRGGCERCRRNAVPQTGQRVTRLTGGLRRGAPSPRRPRRISVRSRRHTHRPALPPAIRARRTARRARRA